MHLARLILFALLLLVAPWASAQITVVATSTTPAPSSSAVSLLTINRPASVAANDVLIAHISSRGAGVTITPPAGWTLVDRTNTLLYVAQAIYRRTVGVIGSEPASYTWTLSSPQRAAISAIALRGVDTANPVNAVDGTAESFGDTTITAASITTTVVNTLLLAMYSVDHGGATFTAPAGMTERVDINTSAGPNGISMAMYSETLAASGATGTRIGTSSQDPDAAVGTLVALKPATTSAVDHYELSLPTASLTCLPTTVSVTACANSSSPCTSMASTLSGQSATLATSGAMLAATSVIFDATGVASTTLSYPGAIDGAAVSVTLLGEQTAATNPRKCCPDGASCVAANSCSSTFKKAGFIFASAANGAAATIPSQVAGTSSSTYYLRAVKTSTTTKACETALSGSTSVNMAYECNNPTTCYSSDLMSVNGGASTTISRNANGSVSSYAPVTMNFDGNGNAPFTFNYADAGQVKLYASKSASGSLLSALTGSSNVFVTKPSTFSLTATCNSTGTLNAASQTSPSVVDAKFCAAGKPFTASVKALTSGGVVTPNYGRESTPETSAATWSRYLPSTGGVDGALPSGTLAFSGGYSGTFTAGSLNWSEVGILSATLTVGDNDYLGAGNVTSSAYVGRFYPDHFDVVVTPQCGGFVYSGRPGTPVSTGQPFTVRATAMNGLSTPTATTNYKSSAGFSKAVNLTLPAGGTLGQIYVDSTPGGTGAIPASKFSSGVGTVNYNDASGRISYVFNAFPTVPTTITIHADDADSATSTGTDGSTSARAGRLQLSNAYGSELLDLPIPLEAQYWASGSYYVTNNVDSCTSFNTSSLVLSNFSQNLAACETQLSPTGSQTLVGGRLPLKLTKPGAGNSGSVSLALNIGTMASGSTCVSAVSSAATAANLPWFGDTNPAGRATFGVYKTPLIYRRENY